MPMERDMQEQFRYLVAQYYNRRVEFTDQAMITTEEVYIVWFVKALKNWKALLSTTVSDGMYYELTYNGDTGETYFDAYKKWENIVVPRNGTLHKMATRTE